MRFLICGDVHAQWAQLLLHMTIARDRGIVFDQVIQVGDFGMYPNTMSHLLRVFENNTTPVHFIDGNHECHPYLRKTCSKLPDRINFHYHKRGDITQLEDGTTIGWMGGALNADRPQESDGSTGYLNIPSDKCVSEFASTINRRKIKVDLMVTHSCPPDIGIGIVGHPALVQSVQEHITDAGFGKTNFYDCGDFFLGNLYTKLDWKPSTWVFGHFHQHRKAIIDHTLFQCVGSTDHFESRRVYIYDTELKALLE